MSLICVILVTAVLICLLNCIYVACNVAKSIFLENRYATAMFTVGGYHMLPLFNINLYLNTENRIAPIKKNRVRVFTRLRQG